MTSKHKCTRPNWVCFGDYVLHLLCRINIKTEHDDQIEYEYTHVRFCPFCGYTPTCEEK